jgi:hypothetical protein
MAFAWSAVSMAKAKLMADIFDGVFMTGFHGL